MTDTIDIVTGNEDGPVDPPHRPPTALPAGDLHDLLDQVIVGGVDRVGGTDAATVNLSASRSTAMIGCAPTSAASMTAAIPTPPAPTTASGLPAQPCTAFKIAPPPVITAHAEIAAISDGTPAGTPTTLDLETTTRSAKHETPIR